MKNTAAEPIKFLLVDDTSENLVALEALLRRPGLEVLKANSGWEALELLLVHEVALAFLDVQMPNMDGFELAELMRGSERTKHVPIIFVTAGASDPHRVFKGYESGAVDFLFKPVDPHILKSKADVFFDLYRQRRDLATSLRLNEMFVGILGHDLRTPLSTMINGARVLQAEVGSSQASQRTLQRMMAAGERMAGMLTQMLDLTRARLGSGVVGTKQHVDVVALVRNAVEELRASYPARELVLESTGNLAVVGDTDRLFQVMSNLITNAFSHGADATPVRISSSGDEREVIVCVHNGGVIPPDLLPNIFDPFRSSRNTSSRTSGLGLGLYISKQILLGHGGALEVESDELKGTLFTVRLPRHG